MNPTEFKTVGQDGSNVTFNQAQFQMMRLHDLISRSEICNTNPLGFNEEIGRYNYEILFSDYCSILLEIISKLSKDEKDNLMDLRKNALKIIRTKSPFVKTNFLTVLNKPSQFRFSDKNWNELNDTLFEFRVSLEHAMEKHGFGNPNVKDSRKSILE